VTKLTKKEHEHRLAFAERQHQGWRQRVTQNQVQAQLELARGDLVAASRALDAAKNWIEHVNACNETIDTHRRALDPSAEDEFRALALENESNTPKEQDTK
jgi:hypothetical protein